MNQQRNNSQYIYSLSLIWKDEPLKNSGTAEQRAKAGWVCHVDLFKTLDQRELPSGVGGDLLSAVEIELILGGH